MGLLPDREMTGIRSTLALTSNARLKKIARPGPPNTYGDPTAGTDLWTGDAPCWFERVRRDEIVGEAQAPGRHDFLTVLDSEVPVLEVAGADFEASVLTVEDRRTSTPVTIMFNVRGIEHVAFNLVDSTRIELDEITG